MAQGLSRADLESSIAKYAPILKLNPNEIYKNCSVEWYLKYSTLIDSTNAANDIVHPTEDQLPQGPKDGTRYSLQVDDAAKPGDFSTAKAYVNALWKSGTTYTDLQFWFFSAFNGPGTAQFESLKLNKVAHEQNVDLSPLGEHWADWEYCGIRIDNTSKDMIGIILSEHGKNIVIDKATVAKQFKFIGTQPVIYSSLNGHANFPTPGPNYTEHIRILGIPVGLDFNLLNTTAEGGLSLDCSKKYEVVAADWLKGTSDAYQIPAWVNYKYRWGPEGTVITMDAKTLGEFIKAALGNDAKPAILNSPIVLLASELLHIFVKADINGADAPCIQGPWVGNY